MHIDIKLPINDISTDYIINAKCIINSYFDELYKAQSLWYVLFCAWTAFADRQWISSFEQCSFFVWRPWTTNQGS